MKISKEYGSRRTTDGGSNEEGNGTDVSADRGISNTTARNAGNAASTSLDNRGIFCYTKIDSHILLLDERTI